METTVKNNRHKYGGTKRVAANKTDTSNFLSHEEYWQYSERQRILRAEIAELNRKINNDKPFRESFKSKKDWACWREGAEKRRDDLLVQYREVDAILAASERARRAVQESRRQQLDGSGVIDILRAAKEAIELLYEKRGDDWTDEHRDLCSDLNHLIRGNSALLHMVNKSELDDLRVQYERDARLQKVATQRAIGELQAIIRGLQAQKTKAAQVLEELWQGKYKEVDEWRKARGMVYRMHVDGEMQQKIEDALKSG